MESAQCGGPPPVSLANRSLLQTDQADVAVGGFPGAQRQRGALANLAGVAGLRAVALLESCVEVGT